MLGVISSRSAIGIAFDPSVYSCGCMPNDRKKNDRCECGNSPVAKKQIGDQTNESGQASSNAFAEISLSINTLGPLINRTQFNLLTPKLSC